MSHEIKRVRSDAVLPTVEALKADKSGQTEYYLMLKTYHCIKINSFAINEIGLINLFVEKFQILKKSLIILSVLYMLASICVIRQFVN